MNFLTVFLIAVQISTVLAERPALADFPYSGRSFDVSKIWVHCMRTYRDVYPTSGVPDYGSVISKQLDILDALGGGTVRLYNGVYNITTPIRVRNKTCIIGQSMSGVILSVSDDAPVYTDKNYRGVLHAIDVANVTIRDITVNTRTPMWKKGKSCENQLTKFGVYFEASDYLNIDNIRVLNACAYGIDFPGNDFKISTNIVLNRVVLDSVGKDAIKIVRSSYVSVLDSFMINSGRHGIQVAGSSLVLSIGTTTTAKIHKRKHSCGILVTDRQGLVSSSVTVYYPRVLHSSRAGICIINSEQVQISGAIIDNLPTGKIPCYEVTSTTNYRIQDGICNNKDTNTIRPKCLGLKRSRTCCPYSCVKCGGTGCSRRAPFGECCVKKIRLLANSCKDSPPPCNL